MSKGHIVKQVRGMSLTEIYRNRSKIEVVRRAMSTVLLCVVIGLLIFRFVGAYAVRIEAGYLDTAGFLDLVGPRRAASPLNGDYFRSARGLELLLTTDVSKVCSVIAQSNFGSPSFFNVHPYLITAPFSLIAWVTRIESSTYAALLLSLSVFVAIFAILFFLLKTGSSRFAVISIAISLLAYPVLFRSVAGQPYFDRLMIGPAVVLILLLWWSKSRSQLFLNSICLSIVTLALISERGAGLAALIGFGYTVLLHGRLAFTDAKLRKIILLGALSAVYLFIWLKYWQAYSAYGQISVDAMWTRLGAFSTEPLRGDLFKFTSVSLAFLVVSLFAGRLYLVLLIAISGNLLISVGGAELTGLLTHYHQTYLPVVIAASAIGLVNLSSWTRTVQIISRLRITSSVIAAIFLAVSIGAGSIAFFEHSPTSLVRESKSVWLPSRSEIARQEDRNKVLDSIAKEARSLNPTVVSAPESLMPTLSLNDITDVEYWPVGVGLADVVIAPFSEDKPDVFPYYDHRIKLVLGACVEQVLANNYKLVSTYFDGSMRLFERK